MGHFLFFLLRKYGKESLTLGRLSLFAGTPRRTGPSVPSLSLVLLRELLSLALDEVRITVRGIGLRRYGRA